jgi:PAS domain S-box-containing protein
MKKILVVDNHPLMIKFMTTLLEKEGHQVMTAEDGLSALEVLKTFTPQVVFTDLVMPNIDGEKFCRIVRGMPELADTYLIILSSIAADEKLDHTSLGADSAIAKGPFDEMERHVLSVLEKLDVDITRDEPGPLIGDAAMLEREVTKELLTSKRHIEIILKNISEGVLELTLERKIVYANAFAVYLLGISEENLLGSNFLELFGEDDQKILENLLDPAGVMPRTLSKDSPINIKGKHVLINTFPAMEGEKKSFIVILSNISELVRLKEKLKKAEGR